MASDIPFEVEALWNTYFEELLKRLPSRPEHFGEETGTYLYKSLTSRPPSGGSMSVTLDSRSRWCLKGS